jgi:hypothetical protein
MDLFAAIEAELRKRRDSRALSEAFTRWRSRREGLQRFSAVEDFIAACRAGDGGSWRATDAALGSLCAEARAGDESAAILLTWLILPGLLRVRAGLRLGEALAPEDLDAELVAGVWEAAARLDQSDRGVARRLVNAARWRVLAALREAIDWTDRTQEIGTEPADRSAPGSCAPEPDDVLAGAVREGVLSPEDAEFVMATRRTIRQLGKRLGLSLRGAQSRRHRARGRLRTWVERARGDTPTNLPRTSHPGPPTKSP